ncbi:hypothetical protein AX769_05110 [Frondihabitans sp. PAMC 28766]|uniref:ATP-binding protein n=1 Tax=Frondihabitans sp. PAMC 28766 TaxID=1795630 RepID=UPI00078D87C7|nr:ATP-binding protein [Frondihabitans sp. PAMC 28766]AMM19631.1 hypothetical protein AX769_05110 [Frondihabitans sp. PAMC 28766]
MADTTNPFKPGAGRVPPELAGRDVVLDGVRSVMAAVIANAEGDRPVIISGLRGVGKTVLLNEFIREADRSRKWIAVKVEASPGRSLREVLTRELHASLRRTMSLGDQVRQKLGRALRVFRSFQMTVDPAGTYSFGFDVSAEVGFADSGDLERDLRELLDELGQGARELGMGVFIAIDELQDAPKSDLNALNLALHALGQSAWPVPVLMVGTGLPSLPAVLADATSYAERLYDFRSLGLLNDDETRAALTRPAEKAGVVWDDAALALALDSIGGYPYFAQSCGKHVWDARSTRGRITLDDATVGVARAREEVDQGLYQSRWERATPKQRELMRAMAADNGKPSAVQDLVARTGKSRASDLSVSRNELIKNGHIFAPDRGFVAFTVPGMADYIHRKVND